MNEAHLNEEQLVFHYYGENPEAERHLQACEDCRGSYQALQRVLNSVDSLPVPDRAPDYESQLWKKLEPQLPRGSRVSRWFTWRPVAAALGVAAMLVLAFLAGRSWNNNNKQETARNGKAAATADGQVRERVLLVAVGNHLERSQMILVELTNAGAPTKGALDISQEQTAAEDLLESNRLYRQTALSTGDVATATMLDELERVLLDIAHSPSEVSAKQLDALRKQIEDQGILFKVKVFGSQVEQRQSSPPVSGAS